MTAARRMRVGVLGGGPAGLAAALWAAEAGHRVVLFEQAERTGGMAASFPVATGSGEIRADYGSHRLHPAIDAEILGALKSLPGLELVRRPRHGRIRLARRWLDFPLRTGDVIRTLPVDLAARAAVDTLTSVLRRERADTYAEVVRAGLGPMMAERFYNPYARKLWGRDPDMLSGEQARRRISAASPVALARKVLHPDPDSRWFWYPANGFGAIAEALDAAARTAGADIRTGHRVAGVEVGGDHSGIATSDGQHDVDVVLSTLPLSLLARIVQPASPLEVRAAAQRLPTRAMVLVYLVITERFSTYDAHYLPEPTTVMTRLSEPPNYAGVRPAGEPSLLCAEIPCDIGDEVWTADDATLADVVTDGIAAMDLFPPDVRRVEVRRVPHAYPVMTLDAPAARDTLESWAGTLPGVLSFGRHGLYAHDNTHHALAEARAAVNVLTRTGIDRSAWASAVTAFRAHVVED